MKFKTSKSTTKRIKITRAGKILRRRMLAQHLVTNKSRRANKAAGKILTVAPNMAKRVKKLI